MGNLYESWWTTMTKPNGGNGGHAHGNGDGSRGTGRGGRGNKG